MPDHKNPTTTELTDMAAEHWANDIQELCRLRKFVQWVADHSNDPAVVREARKHGAVTVEDHLGR